MKTLEKRAKQWATNYPKTPDATYTSNDIEAIAENSFIHGATEQKAIDDKRTKELLQYLEELEAHYRKLGQYDDGKPIRRVKEYIKSMEKRYA